MKHMPVILIVGVLGLVAVFAAGARFGGGFFPVAKADMALAPLAGETVVKKPGKDQDKLVMIACASGLVQQEAADGNLMGCTRWP